MPEASRLERERAFHDERFTEETRTSQEPFYEVLGRIMRRYEETVRDLSKGRDVLEYGCATGDTGLALARDAKSITGIDISPVGIARANQRAADAGIDNAAFAVMDAENLEFPDDSFDLVFGSGIVHHLDVDRSFSEVSRVLRPDGIAVFIEPLGHNPLINAYRNRTPEARTPDEHPLLKTDFATAQRYFARADFTFDGLLSVAAIAARRHAPTYRAVRSVLSAADRAVLRGPLRWQAWYSMLLLRQPVAAR